MEVVAGPGHSRDPGTPSSILIDLPTGQKQLELHPGTCCRKNTRIYLDKGGYMRMETEL